MRRGRVLIALSFVAAAVAGMLAGSSPAGAGRDDRAGYIVVLHDDADPGSVATRHAHSAQVGHRYGHALRGYSASLSDAEVAELASDPQVAYVVPDGPVTIVHHRSWHDAGGDDGGGSDPTACTQVLPWGIDRVDADASSTLAGNCAGAVSNVNVYVIDTGVDAKHPDLNVAGHVNFAGGKNTDCNGHGTHVAGTAAARDNTRDVVGMAPGAPVTGVKVLGCGGSGTWSGVIAGIDWVTANAVKPAVANMSLGGGANQAVDDAVRRSAAAGVLYAVAAGNEGANACTRSPARAGTTDGVVTVAATSSSNSEASWSNYGSCVDIWAPGVSILSTRRGGGTTTMSGTSMASPHVAGGAALYLSSHTTSGPASVESALKGAASATGTNSKDGRAISLLDVGTF